jgi:acetyltransferase
MVVELSDRTRLEVREIRPTDKELLSAGLARLSEETVYRRFLGPKPSFSRAELRYLTEVDGRDHVALVALDPAEESFGREQAVIGVARFVRLGEDPRAAEISIVVGDAYQRKGLGTTLGLALADAALERGIERFTASMLGQNAAAHGLLRSLSERMERGRAEGGVEDVVLHIGDRRAVRAAA